MGSGYNILQNRYFDSVFLMQIADRLLKQHKIKSAAALMGTENNKKLLAEIGFESPEILAAGSNDLIVALIGNSQSTIDTILGNIDSWLIRKTDKSVDDIFVPTVNNALSIQPLTNLAVISIPGEYVTTEALKALEAGLNIFIFSSNVPVEEEYALKKYAHEHDLIVMGPDCGTSIINGIGIGFANVVRHGPIGVIGSSGTGLQEFTCLVHQNRGGISHAIGTGSRDLSDIIGGISTFSALEMLEADSQTEVICLISKPPGEETIVRLIERLKTITKPVVTCFLGPQEYLDKNAISCVITDIIDDASERALSLAGVTTCPSFDMKLIKDLAAKERSDMALQQKYLRGLFAGGTFCYQAQQLMRDSGIIVYSNTPLKGMLQLKDPLVSQSHSIIDLGDEFFTNGRPHPMIDSSLRRECILKEAEDPQVAVLLLDFILGFNSSSDPVGDLIDAIRKAKNMFLRRKGYLCVVASVTGTEEDPQDINMQINALKDAGVVVFRSSAQAALFCRTLITYN